MIKLSVSRFCWKGIWGEKFRSFILILCLAAGTIGLFLLLTFLHGTLRSIDREKMRLGADLLVVPRHTAYELESALIAGVPSDKIYMDEKILGTLAKIKELDKFSPQLFLRSLTMGCCGFAESYRIVGYDPFTDFTILPQLSEKERNSLTKHSLIVGCNVPVAGVGKKCVLFETPFKVSKALARTGMGVDYTLFMPLETAREILATPHAAGSTLGIKPTDISTILVKVKKGTDIEDTCTLIEYLCDYKVKTLTVPQLLKSVIKRIKFMTRFVFLSLGFIIILMAGMVLSSFSLLANERRREIAVIRGFGANKWDVFRLIFLEVFFLSLIGGISGVVIGELGFYTIIKYYPLTINFPFCYPTPEESLLLGGITLLIVLFIGVISSLYPAYKCASLEPEMAMRERR